MKTLKPFTIVLSSLIIIFPLQLANTCGWGYEMDETTLSPFHSEILDLPELFPFYYSEHFYNGDPNTDWSENGGMMQVDLFDGTTNNLNEWQAYFNNGMPIADLTAIIYNTAQSDYEAFANYLKGKKNGVAEQWLNNSVLQYWKNNPKDPSFKYLMLAKQIEPQVQPSGWWEDVRMDTPLLIEYKNEAVAQLKKSNSEFITLRYAYQAARCAHYTGAYQECIDIYEQYVAPIQTETQIKYWSMSLMAGAQQRLNNKAVAAYYHAMVFDKCWSRRLSSKRDFSIDNENTWQQCLSMCKNDAEKNMLWFLTGVSQYNSAVPALYEMLKIDPASKEIELLLSREVEKIQRNTMPERWWNGKEEDAYEVYARTTIEPNDIDEIISVIETGLTINKMRSPSFWYNAGALLYFIKKDAANCNKMCSLAIQNANGNMQFIDQAKIIIALNKVSAAGGITPVVEKEIINELKWLADTRQGSPEMLQFKADAYRLIMYNLMSYYLNDNKSLLAELCRSRALSNYDIYIEPEKAPIDELYAFFTSKNKSEFEVFLSSQYPYTTNDLLEIKGTLLMRENKLAEAVTTFKKIEDAQNYLTPLSADPFVTKINDCHDCDFTEHPTELNKLDLVEKILALKELAKSDATNRASIYHELGNAYYNMSYWGNAWNALDYYRCHGCETNVVDPQDSYYYYYSDQFDLTNAEYYYKLATKTTNSNEFAALNYFMLAKCEQNQYYRSGDYEYENANGKKEDYRANFYILHNMFSTTTFYQEAINECKYFDFYANTH